MTGGWCAWAVGRAPSPDDPVFASIHGAHWRPKSAREIRFDLEAAGLPSERDGAPIDFHATRRSFATWANAEGVPIETVGRLLGHVGKSVASVHYTATALRGLAEDVARIPFRWQDPPPLGSPPGGSREHSADLVRAHNGGQEEPSQPSEVTTEAPVAQWIEQRFPNSPVNAPSVDEIDLAHNMAGVLGAETNPLEADSARYEQRAERFGRARRRVQRQESRAARRSRRVWELLHHAKDVATGAARVPQESREGYVRGLLGEAALLLDRKR